MSKDRKALPAPPPAPSGGWIMTFADLMSLLMAFFVMLLAMAEVDKAKFDEMGKSMKVAFSPIHVTAHSSDDIKPIKDITKTGDTTQNMEDQQNMEAQKKEEIKIQQTQEDAAKLSEVLEEQIKESEVEVETRGRLIVIRLLDSGVFESGKANLKADFAPALLKMRDSLKGIDGDIVVSGYTDDIPIVNDRFRSNWELSAGRAYSVIEQLRSDSKLKGERFVLRGFGETRPLAPNTNAENRSKNRRVEIVIDQRDPVKTNTESEKTNISEANMADAPMPKDV